MKNDKALTPKHLAAIKSIRNSLVHKGRTPTVRELMAALGYKSPRSAQDVLEQLAGKGIIRKRPHGDYQLVTSPDFGVLHAQTVDVPLLGTIAAGAPIFAEENLEGYIPVSTSLAKPGAQYFLLHVRGDSMVNADINDGDLVLVRQQPVAEEGQIVVALIDGEATVKEFRRGKGVMVLNPRSRNSEHKPIIVTEDFQIQGVVISAIPKLE
jgi:repressor LexA